MLSIKLDIATRLDRSILGVNVQSIDEGMINVYTLGMISLEKSQTAEYIKEELLNCLREFNIIQSIRSIRAEPIMEQTF